MLTRKLIPLVLAIAMVLSFTVGCSDSSASTQSEAPASTGSTAESADSTVDTNTDDPIIIAGILPISTGDAGWHLSKGVELAVNQANERGGVLGRQLKFVLEDDAAKPDSGVKALKLLIDQKPDAIFGSHHSAVMQATMDLVKEYGHPQFTTCPSNVVWDAVAESGNEWIFATRSCDIVSVRALVEWALEQEYKNVGIITETGAWPMSFTNTFTEYYSERDPNVQFSIEEFTTGDKDFTAQLTKLMNNEATLVSGYPQDTANIAAQIKRIGYTGQVLATSSAGVSYFPELAGTDADGWIIETNYVAGASDLAEAKAFEEAFMAAYDKMPSEMAAAMYDGVNLYLAAVEKAGTTDPEAVRTALLEIKNFAGVQGPLSYFSNGKLGNKRTLCTLEGGKYKVVEIIETDYNPDAQA